MYRVQALTQLVKSPLDKYVIFKTNYSSGNNKHFYNEKNLFKNIHHKTKTL